nr:putative ribonuclease H-like domain-containing protein [Tanacetum cinerariifolium]
MIGSLMYLTSSRPDIMFVVCACARYEVNLKVSDLHAVKRIFRYLKGHPQFGLWYPKDLPFDFVAYTYSDYAGASLDKKSTTGGCQYLGCRLISWQCKKHTVVVNFTTEVEYVVASSCYGQVLWIQINYLIMVYTSCIKQFWITVMVKTVNEEVQLRALVDGKKVIITESTIRRDLQLEDAEGVNCLPNVAIFEQLTLMRKPKRKVSEVPQPSDPTEHVADEAVNEEMDENLERAATTDTSLDVEQDRGNIFKTQSKATPNEPGSQRTSSSGAPMCQETMRDIVAQTRFERVSKISNDPLFPRVNIPRSGKDSLKLNELCTKLQQRVLDLETIKITQALEIDSLKRRVKKLERRKRIADINANKDIYLVNIHNDEDMFGVNDLDGDEVIVERVNVVEQAKEVVDDITLAKALMEIKSAKPKADKVVIQEPEQCTTTTTPTTITATSSRPEAKGLVIHEQEQAPTSQGQGQSSKKAEAEVTKGSSKRAGEELEQENAKKQKMKDDKESVELKQCLEIIPDDRDDVTIDTTHLSTKEDLKVLWRLVKARFKKIQPVDYMDNLLLHSLKTMFDIILKIMYERINKG